MVELLLVVMASLVLAGAFYRDDILRAIASSAAAASSVLERTPEPKAPFVYYPTTLAASKNTTFASEPLRTYETAIAATVQHAQLPPAPPEKETMNDSMLAIFCPQGEGPKDCIVFNGDGAVISQLFTEQQARAFAATVVNGRVLALAGTIECYVMRVNPLTRVRDSSIADTQFEDVAAPSPTQT